tara:strand:- start:775 stop:1050 length:276 start_codon:yes stop_codon:yes gene_type:complete
MDYLIWFGLPILLIIFELISTIVLIRKKRTFFYFLASGLIILLNLIAIIYLIQMMSGAWPTYTPYILIVIGVIILAIQERNTNNKTHNNNG